MDEEKSKEELLIELASLREQTRHLSQQKRMLRMTEDLTGVGYWSLDTRSGTLHWSDAVYAIHGLSRHKYTPSLPSAIDFYHPDDRETVRRCVDSAVSTKADFSIQVRLIRNDGALRIVEALGRRAFDETGALCSLVGLFRDITDKMDAERELRRSNERLRAHVENTPLGMIEWDKQFRVVEWNARCEEIFGYTKAEALGQNGAELLTSEDAGDASHVHSVFEQLLAQTGGTYSTNVNITKAHERIVCDWYNTSLVDRDGGVTGVASIVQDRSERLLLESQFAQSQKLESLGTLAGGIAHDMNNILAVVLGLGTIVEMELDEQSELREDMQDILAAARRGKDMVANLLAFARKGSFERTVFPLAKGVEALVSLLQKTIPKEIRCDVDCPDDLWHVRGDENQLMSAFMNLCLNAAQAIEGHGVITVSARNRMLDEGTADAPSTLKPGPYVCLRVTDDGRGMDALTLKRSMEPFFTTKDVGEGTGLGLSMVYGAVESHGGSVAIESALGSGTTVSVFLPGQLISQDAEE